MAMERRYLPLLMLSLFVLFLYSYTHSSLPISTPTDSSSSSSSPLTPTSFNPSPNLDLSSPPPKFTLTIKLLAFNRIISLTRCLRSLSAADYGGDKVHLHIFIDHFPFTDNKDAVLDKKLEDSHAMLGFVDGFSWKHGDKMVHYRTGNVGLQAQWLEAWWPSSDDEFVFVVEDDLEVSPLYYKFLRELIVYYQYNTSNYSPSIFGATLQRPRFVPGKHGNKMQLDNESRLFLYPLVGTWGQLLFPKPWKEFRLWYDTHKAKGIKPLLQGMVTTGWYKKMGEKIWTPWFIKFIYSRSYYNIYTNFPGEAALSVSHRDAGVNYGSSAGPDSHLLYKRTMEFDLLEMLPLSNLNWYDFCFRGVHPEYIVKSFTELGAALNSLQKQKTIILVSLFGASEAVTRNLLCHFEKLTLRNYILVGPKSTYMLDLARRGHPVIDVDVLLGSIFISKFTMSQDGNTELTKEITLNAYLIKKCLESGYDVWLIDGNMLLSGSAPLSVSYPNYDIYVGEATELFFARSSSSSQKLWTEAFIHKVAEMATLVRDSSSGKSMTLAHILRSLLERTRAKIKTLDERSFGMKIDGASSNNRSSLGDTDKMLFWTSDLDASLIQKRLDEVGMWMVDDELSCTSVFCHQS